MQPDLCQTCSETTLLVFPQGGSYVVVLDTAGSLGLGDLHAEKSSGSSNKDSKQANTEKKTAKDDEQSEEGQGHTENDSDTNDYDPKLAQESDEHDVSMRSVEGNEAVSSSHESPGLTEKEVIEETKKEFLKLKEKR